MPGFTSTTTALSLYHIADTGAVTFDKLKQYAFRSIDDIPESRGTGWTNSDDMFDTEWRTSPPEKGGFICFAFRQDIRKVSPAILKKHLAEALRLEAENEEGFKISRSRRKELKEQHTAKLLSQTEPVPTAVDAALDTASGILYVGTVSTSALEAFESLFESSFGVKPVRMTLAGLDGPESLAEDAAVEQLMHTMYTTNLTAEVDGHQYAISEAGQATLAEEGSEVTIKNAPDSASAGLEAGLSIKKLKIRIERNDDESLAWELTLNHDFSFPSLKTPKVTKESGDGPDAAMLEKIYLISQAVNVILALGRQQV